MKEFTIQPRRETKGDEAARKLAEDLQRLAVDGYPDMEEVYPTRPIFRHIAPLRKIFKDADSASVDLNKEANLYMTVKKKGYKDAILIVDFHLDGQVVTVNATYSHWM
ncbi:MAG: hypothetical protein V4664_04020 [Patescibacteria group bacterium]